MTTEKTDEASTEGGAEDVKVSLPDGKRRLFLRRTSDGKYFRGAKYWRWCTSWRHAALLEKGFWETFVVWKLKRAGIEYEYATLDDLETR